MNSDLALRMDRLQLICVPGGKLKHADKSIVMIDDPKRHFENASAVRVAVFLMPALLQERPHQLLCCAPGFITADINRVLWLFKGIPVVIAALYDMFLSPRGHALEDSPFSFLRPAGWIRHTPSYCSSPASVVQLTPK
jgi:hypothetical protein